MKGDKPREITLGESAGMTSCVLALRLRGRRLGIIESALLPERIVASGSGVDKSSGVRGIGIVSGL